MSTLLTIAALTCALIGSVVHRMRLPYLAPTALTVAVLAALMALAA